jgi:hypothetical protein
VPNCLSLILARTIEKWHRLDSQIAPSTPWASRSSRLASGVRSGNATDPNRVWSVPSCTILKVRPSIHPTYRTHEETIHPLAVEVNTGLDDNGAPLC